MAPHRKAHRGRRLNHSDASPERKPDFSKLIRSRGNHIYFYCPVTEESIIELIIKVHECKDAEVRRLAVEAKFSDGEEEEDDEDANSEHTSSSGVSSQGANAHLAEKAEPLIHMTPLVEPACKENFQVYIHLFTEVRAEVS